MTKHAAQRDVREAVALRLPGGTIGVGERLDAGVRYQRDDIALEACGVCRARGLVRREPQRRPRLLQRLALDAHVPAPVKFAFVAHYVGRQRLENKLGGLPVHRGGLCGIDAEAGEFYRGGAAAEAQFQPPAAHVIEHHHLFRNP